MTGRATHRSISRRSLELVRVKSVTSVLPWSTTAAWSACYAGPCDSDGLDGRDAVALLNVRTSVMATEDLPASLSPRVLVAAVKRRPESSIHQRLEGALRELITSGQIKAGTVIVGELELADKLHLSRHTVRHALGVLADEGLLRRERGRGTTVVTDTPPPVIERSLASFYAFAWEARAAGAEQRSRILERSALPASEVVAKRLRLRRGALVERIVRERTLNAEPLVLETAFLPHALASALDTDVLEHGSIYDALERAHGLAVSLAHETIQPTILRRATARLLAVPSGSAAFSVERTTWSDTGPIEWQTSLVRGDRYLYSVDLPRRT
jgi:GntR family transcriptional regulator